jgi:DNA-binding transcriptional LysR family regulator
MPEVLRRVSREAPGINFALRQTVNFWLEDLARGAIDLVLIPAIFASAQHGQASLFEEDFTCVVWAENTQVQETLSLEQYLALGHVGVAFGPTYNLSIEHSLLSQHGYRRRLEVVAPTFALLPHLLIGTNRIATMHSRLAKLAAQSLPLRLFPLPVELPPMTEVMQWPMPHTEEPGSQWLRTLLLETARQL